MSISGTVARLLLASLLLSSGCMGHRDLRPGRTRVPAPNISVPATIIANHFVVEAKWDRKGPWHFLIDTGSSVTIVSPEFARRYATEKAALAAPPVRVKSANGDSTLLPAVTLHRIALGEARFDNVQALVRDLGDLSAHLGVKIDGVLAFPLFRNTVFTLDYPNSKLLLSPTSDVQYLPGSTVKFNNAQRTPLIPITIGNTTLVALIDSGNDGPLLLNPAGLELHYQISPRPGTTVGTLTGNRTQEIGRLSDSLSIGTYRFVNPVVDLGDQLSAIGGEVLRNFAVTFDQLHNQVTFYRETPGPIPPTGRRSSGLAFSKGPVYWRVVGVVPGSPADEAGIQDGDLVTRVNGEAVSNWPLQRFEPFVKRNAEIIFTFVDGAKEKPVVIPTMELP